MVSPRSDSHRNRTVPDDVWSNAARKFNGTAFWLGRHKAPRHFVDLNCRHLDSVIKFIGVADLFVGVDSGPAHIAIAQGIPAIVIEQASSPDLHFSDQRDFITIRPDNLNCLNCQATLCPIDSAKPPCQNILPEIITNAVNKRLEWTREMKVSAVVAIYRPKMEMLNRCLYSLIPQVDEIVVVSDQAGVVPVGAMTHQKIRYVKSWQNDIGYGRKAQLGARHASGGWILFCNDDIELNPGCVKNMLAEGVADVGIVSCLLRYRDGTIQHAGKVRRPHEKGWGHIDLREMEPTFKEATDQENTCGALQLVRRKCFYDAGAFDEDYFLYCEDDSFCLSARKAGWRIVFTPHATAIHDEHKSTELVPHIIDVMHQSNAIFGRKWGKYLEWNSERIPGDFRYLNEKV